MFICVLVKDVSECVCRFLFESFKKLDDVFYDVVMLLVKDIELVVLLMFEVLLVFLNEELIEIIFLGSMNK